RRVLFRSHPTDLLGQGADAWRQRIAVVAEQDRRLNATQMAHCRCHAALELVVVVGIKQVVLAVVLVLHHRLQLAETLGEALALRLAVYLLAVGIAAPVEVGAGQVSIALPVARVDQALQAGAVGAGLGAEDTEAGLPPRGLDRKPLSL